MFKPEMIIERAKTSKMHLALLNFVLARKVPFNKPHGFKIIELGNDIVRVKIPYKRINFNHIRGIHACALATASEYSTGFILLNKLDSKKYRIIMQKMEMNYHYQGKMDVIVTYELSDQWLKTNVLEPLENEESIIVNCEVKSHDIEGNHLSTGNIFWQVKPWEKVKTKA
jgi:acyl-coenzyme A thioesterase PaaI-like protein